MLEGQYARGERERLLAENERLRKTLESLKPLAHGLNAGKIGGQFVLSTSWAIDAINGALAEGGAHAPR